MTGDMIDRLDWDRLSACFQVPFEGRITDWLESNYILTKKFSAQPGPVRLSQTPHLIEPINSLTNPALRTLIVVGCNQGGKTLMVEMILAWAVCCRPGPALWIQPTEDEITEIFRRGGRLRSSFQSCPAALSRRRGRDWATNYELNFSSMTIYGGWLMSPRTLERRAICYVCSDEVDTIEETSGFMGNFWQKQKKRLTTFGHRGRQIGTGIPGDEDGTLWREYKDSDQRVFWEPCPLCGTYQELTPEHIYMSPAIQDRQRIVREKLARYECVKCGMRIGQEYQHWMADRGIYVPAGQRIDDRLEDDWQKEHALAWLPDDKRWRPKIVGDAAVTDQFGFRFWAANLKWENCSWSHIAAERLRAARDPGHIRVLKTATYARPWSQATEAVTKGSLDEKIRQGHEPGVVPDRARILIMSADTQDYDFWYVLRAWGPGEESWLIDYGNVQTVESLRRLAFERQWTRQDGRVMRAALLAIDSGGHRSDEIKRFADTTAAVIAIKGMDRQVWSWKTTPMHYRFRGGEAKGAKRLYLVNAHDYSSKLAAYIKKMPGEDGCFHVHKNTTQEYVKHITNMAFQKSKNRKTGKIRWYWGPKTPSAPNHLWDCEVYGMAAFDIFRGDMVVREDTPIVWGAGLTGERAARPVVKRRNAKENWVAGDGGWV